MEKSELNIQNEHGMKTMKLGKEKWQLPVRPGYQKAATQQTLLIVTKRGNAHHYTGNQLTD